jgi:hypothetical protein
MRTDDASARTIAGLLLLQMVGGPIVNFALMGRVTAAPGFLAHAAGLPVHVGLAALLGIALGAASVGIAIAAWPVLRRHGEAAALWLFAFAVASFALATVEAATVLAMRSLSEAYLAAGTDAGAQQALAGVVAAARRWAHYTHLVVGGGTAFVLYLSLLRHALVPRVLAGFGVVAALAMLAAVALPLFGERIVFPLLAPLGLAHLALAAWLLAKGFSGRATEATP